MKLSDILYLYLAFAIDSSTASVDLLDEGRGDEADVKNQQKQDSSVMGWETINAIKEDLTDLEDFYMNPRAKNTNFTSMPNYNQLPTPEFCTKSIAGHVTLDPDLSTSDFACWEEKLNCDGTDDDLLLEHAVQESSGRWKDETSWNLGKDEKECSMRGDLYQQLGDRQCNEIGCLSLSVCTRSVTGIVNDKKACWGESKVRCDGSQDYLLLEHANQNAIENMNGYFQGHLSYNSMTCFHDADYSRFKYICFAVLLVTFAIIFAINSSIHSFLVVNYSEGDKLTTSVGFYYMSNCVGRLMAILGSGPLYTYVGENYGPLAGSDAAAGLAACFLAGTIFSAISAVITIFIDDQRDGLQCGPCTIVNSSTNNDTAIDEVVEKKETSKVSKSSNGSQSLFDAARSKALRPFVIISSSYLLFTITDGASRMIVLLHAYSKSFTVIEVACMFSLYELAGVVTNLLAGIMGAKWGIKLTLLAGLLLQLLSYGLLFGWQEGWSKQEAILHVTIAQILSGVAKDLTKLGGKTVTKLVTPEEKETKLFKLVSFITGWKNSLKGVGYFLGSYLLRVSYNCSLTVMVCLVLLAMPWALFGLDKNLGTTKKRNASLKDIFIVDNRNLKLLSLARLFLFASREVWFEVPLPYFFRSPSCEGLGSEQCLTTDDCVLEAECGDSGFCENFNPGGGCGGLGVPYWWVGGILGGYIIIYGQAQSWTPQLVTGPLNQTPPNKLAQVLWCIINCIPMAVMYWIMIYDPAFQDKKHYGMITCDENGCFHVP